MIVKHSATIFTPKEARKPSDELSVRLNISRSGKRNRVYPEPNEKERIGQISKNAYTIEGLEKKLSQS